MITDVELLQANVTITVGVLIFLTIAPYSRGTIPQIRNRRIILGTLYAMLVALNVSVMAIFFPRDDYETSLIIAKILFVVGISGIMLIIGVILRTLPKVGTEQTGQDEHQ